MASRYTPRATMRVLTTDGIKFMKNLDDVEASAVGRHWNAVRRYLETGLDYDLSELYHWPVGAYTLETRLDRIEYHATRGEVGFEDIYGQVQ